MISEMKETDLGLLPKSWDLQILGDLLYIKGRIGWKGLKKSEYLEEGYAIINGEQIISDKVNWNSTGRISKERFLESPEIILKRKDILMTKDGTIGKIAYVDHLPEDATVASGVFVIRKESKLLHTKYLYNFFKSRYFKWLIKGRTEGSVIPHLYQRDFKEMMIPLPSFEEQKAIAKILTAFDDKIELLQAQNKTLETMAQTIFKEWFGKYQVGDELPEGWRVGDIYNVLEVQYGYPFKSKLFNENKEGLPLIRIRDIRKGVTGFYTTEDYEEEYIIRPGDVLAGMDAVFKPYLWSGGKGLLNQRACRFIPKDFVSRIFVFEFMKPHLSFYEKTKVGTTVIHLGKGDLDFIETVIPDKESLLKFKTLSTPIEEKIINNQQEIQSLTKSRDILLPKLMSGQVRVKNLKQKADA
tara:strand:- start:185 stop:1420 length:1236 start_codon:yes stop_codon:yes gene_type:complete